MCPKDDSHLTIEYKNYFIITPAIKFNKISNNFQKNRSVEVCKKVKKNFEYSSGTNSNFISVRQLKELNKTYL